MISSISTKRGNFTVEFAIVGIFFSLLFAFSGDVIIKLSYKGKLDRLSFSAVNILKERTQLYETRESIPAFDVQASEVIDIAKSSLQRMISAYDESNFSYSVEGLTYDGGSTALTTYPSGNSTKCGGSQSLKELDIDGDEHYYSVVSSWGRRTSLYRVTLCYDTNNWIGSLIGTDFTRVTSSSVIIGR
ncbi:tight adherence pilus pseudopilin TadF [Vibrio astriarenae]